MKQSLLIVTVIIGSFSAGCSGAGEDLSNIDTPVMLDGSIPGETSPDATIAPDGAAKPSNVLVTLQPGTFTMGSPAAEPCRDTNETSHKVTLTRRFQILSTEVTQKQFAGLMGYQPFSSCGSGCPVSGISWHEAAAYCNALSRQKGQGSCYACTGKDAALKCSVAPKYAAPSGIYSCPGYRLPTEAEWEYAFRAGTNTALYNGATGPCAGAAPGAAKIAWFKANAVDTIHPVGKKQANPAKLHDMAGNVAEWVHDWYTDTPGAASVKNPAGPKTGTERVLKGGGFDSPVSGIRAAARDSDSPVSNYEDYGFRVVRSLF